MAKKFQPFRIHPKNSPIHQSMFKAGYADPSEKIVRGLGEKSQKYPLPAFSRNQVGNCCGLVCLYGVGGNIAQFEFSLDLAMKQSVSEGGVGAGALLVALPRPQVERYHPSLVERGFEVIYGVHNSNYPVDADNDIPDHDILLYALAPKRCYNQKRDWKNAEFIQG